MAHATLEHVNITVSEPAATAKRLCELFDWKVRWHGDAINNGITYHVGSNDSYLAVYSSGDTRTPDAESYVIRGGLNHVGVVVQDLDEIEKRVLEMGYETFSHGDYEPGRRFYFKDSDDIEFEVVSYAKDQA